MELLKDIDLSTITAEALSVRFDDIYIYELLTVQDHVDFFAELSQFEWQVYSQVTDNRRFDLLRLIHRTIVDYTGRITHLLLNDFGYKFNSHYFYKEKE